MINSSRSPIKLFFVLFLLALIAVPLGCTKSSDDSVLTVGIISHMPESSPVFEGFESGLKDLGYTKNENLVIIYRSISESIENGVEQPLNELIDMDIDLLLTAEHDITLNCRPITEEKNIPVVFVSSPDPVETGLVDSLTAPGKNLTGVRLPETAYKTLEWLSAIIPNVKRIYLPYNATEHTSQADIEHLKHTAVDLGLEIDIDEVRSAEEAAVAIESLREDIDAVFCLPSRSLNFENDLITHTATELGLPTCASLLLDDDILLTFTADFSVAGEQAARLTHQIFTGVSPSDIPVETSDAFLIINLITAEKIGVSIPAEYLALAKTIIR